jgi:hypothetical protein
MKQKLWCCVCTIKGRLCFDWPTLAGTKKESIKKFEAEGIWNWENHKKRGWKCIKVKVEIKPINEVK